MKSVCVQGLGFVGAAMAIAVSSIRNNDGSPVYDVTGIDLPTEEGRARIAAVDACRFPFETTDGLLGKAAAAASVAGNLRATDDPDAMADADVVIVDINLDVDRSADVPRVDLAAFRQAVRTIGERIRPGALVLIETTVPPGTCEKVVTPVLQLAFEERGLDPDDILLAHSFERVMPGREYLRSITHYWRVYAGRTQEASDACEAFLTRLIDTEAYPLTRLDSLVASETAKVMENSYRAANIAFVEEWARFAEAAGFDLFQVIDAIRLRPTHNNIRQPGFGVGGYCLTKDPFLAGIGARDLIGCRDLSFPFSEQAVRVNEDMPLVSLERLQTLLGGTLEGKRILVMGVTYRQDVADTRYSPSETFVKEAQRRGGEILACDPLIDHWPELEMKVLEGPPPADSVDGVVFAVPHEGFRMFNLVAWLEAGQPAILDANNVLTRDQRAAAVDAGCIFASIGRGRA